LTHHCTKHCFV